MPWLQQGNKRYYYRSVRVNGRPRSVYVGTGKVGEIAAAADQLRRTRREHLKDEQQQILANAASAAELNGQLEALTRAALIAAGFHQHARCQWRRRHHAQQR